MRGGGKFLGLQKDGLGRGEQLSPKPTPYGKEQIPADLSRPTYTIKVLGVVLINKKDSATPSN